MFDNSRAVTNQTMCNELQFEATKNPKLNVKPAKVALSQQNTIDKCSTTAYKTVFKDLNKIQNKLEKKFYKLEMRSNMSPDRNYSDATTATASHDERRISIYLRTLEEVATSNPDSRSLFMYVRENLEKLFHSLLHKKKEENEHISSKIEALKKELQNERKLKQKAVQLNESCQQEIKASAQSKNSDDFLETLQEKMDKNQDLKRKIERQEALNQQMAAQVKALRKREIEIIKRWDLDDVDLVTERLKILKSSTSAMDGKKNPKKRCRVPKLDFTRVYEIQHEQNEEFEEEEEEDEEEDMQGEYYHEGHSTHLSESAHRQVELQKRKDKIIAILNNCYDKNEYESGSEQQEESIGSAKRKLKQKLGVKKEIEFYPDQEDSNGEIEIMEDESAHDDTFSEDFRGKQRVPKSHSFDRLFS